MRSMGMHILVDLCASIRPPSRMAPRMLSMKVSNVNRLDMMFDNPEAINKTLQRGTPESLGAAS
jgi:hypothetical protein